MKTNHSFGIAKKLNLFHNDQFIIKSSSCNRLKGCIDNLRSLSLKNEHGFYLRISFG